MNLSIDCDGVLLDYQKGYIKNWEKHFGYTPELVNPNGFMFHERYNIPKLVGDELAEFQATFDEDFWGNLDPIPFALEGCKILHEAGFKLFCNTAIDPKFKNARANNLLKHGFVFEDVLPTPPAPSYNRRVDDSPKIDACKNINAVVHIDDYGPFFRGFPPEIRKIMIGSSTDGFVQLPFDVKMSDLVQSAHYIIMMRTMKVIK